MCQEDDDFTDGTMEQRFEFTLCPYGKTTVIYGTKGSRSPQFQSMEKFYKQMVESQSGVAENATDVSEGKCLWFCFDFDFFRFSIETSIIA